MRLRLIAALLGLAVLAACSSSLSASLSVCFLFTTILCFCLCMVALIRLRALLIAFLRVSPLAISLSYCCSITLHTFAFCVLFAGGSIGAGAMVTVRLVVAGGGSSEGSTVMIDDAGDGVMSGGRSLGGAALAVCFACGADVAELVEPLSELELEPESLSGLLTVTATALLTVLAAAALGLLAEAFLATNGLGICGSGLGGMAAFFWALGAVGGLASCFGPFAALVTFVSGFTVVIAFGGAAASESASLIILLHDVLPEPRDNSRSSAPCTFSR